VNIVCLSRESEWSEAELTELNRLGNFVQVTAAPKSAEELVRQLTKADYAIAEPLSFGPFSQKIFECLPQLKGVSIVTTRFAWIDTVAAKKRRVVVSNLPGYSTVSVAELALGLMLAVSRKITQAAASTKMGNHTYENYLGRELKNKTLGIIGLGSIGSYIGRLGKCLGMNVVGFNRTQRFGEVPQVDLNKLLTKSDIISMNLALNPETQGFLNREKLWLAKPSAVVINVSPEGLIDQETIYEMLAERRLYGYGFEVDKGRHNPTQEKLLQLPNVIATPHCGWYTPEAQQRVKDLTIANVKAMIEGKPINTV